MSTAHCPLCRETYLAAATVCADCRVALVLDPPEGLDGPDGAVARGDGDPTGAAAAATPGDGEQPTWPEGDEEVGYDLDDWGPAEREALTGALRAERVPHEWRDDEIVVPERWADVTEELIDALDHPDALDADDADDDGGAELLGALYVASDVLSGDPGANGAVIEVLELAPTVAVQSPPYGVEASVWSVIREQVAALATLLEDDADPDDVQAVAVTLRGALRPLV